MGWTRHTGTVVSLVMLVSVAANYAVHRQFERRIQQQLLASSDQTARQPGALIFDACPIPGPGDFVPSVIPRCLDELDFAGDVTPALQTDDVTEIPSGSQVLNPVPVPPETIAVDEDLSARAEPTDPINSGAVRAVIEDELMGSSREERDIWYDELKSLPAGVVRDLLQVRKQLRALPRALHKMDPVAAPRLVEVIAEPASQSRRQNVPDWSATVAALEQACTISRHNLANATTPGFKRLRVTLADAYGAMWHDDEATIVDSGRSSRLSPIQVEGCSLAETLLDLKQGPLHQTDRPLDLAIDGEGFFVAKRHDKLVYTRCGAMTLDAERRLCLIAGTAPIDPTVTIPQDAREIQISSNGTVKILHKTGIAPVVVGQIALARFASPARLRAIGGTLLTPTEASGTAELGSPDEAGCGAIQQGCLEQSNVEPDEEMAEIEQWQSLLKMFPATNRPVTATGQSPQSR